MLTHGSGSGDELDLESILEEFSPQNQIEQPPAQATPMGVEDGPNEGGKRVEGGLNEGGKRAENGPKAGEERAENGPRTAPQPPAGDAPPCGETEGKTPPPAAEKPRNFFRRAAKSSAVSEEGPPRRLVSADGDNSAEKVKNIAKSEENILENREKTQKESKSETSRRLVSEDKADLPEKVKNSGKDSKKLTEKKKKLPKESKTEKPKDNIVEFPAQEMGLTRRLERLVEKGDRYAEGMFPDDAGPDTQELRRERLLPGVDYEDDPTHVPPPRPKRKVADPKPDLTAAQLAGKYKKGLRFLHTRVMLALVLTLAQVYLLVAAEGRAPLPEVLRGEALVQLSALVLALAALAGFDVLAHGIIGIFKLRPELETVLLFAVMATAADAMTMTALNPRDGAMPYTAAASACIFFALWGRYTKRKAQRLNARTVAGRKEPYVVTLDERVWNGEDAYMKWSGEFSGFGAQAQDTDGAQRAYHMAAPILLILAPVLTLFASVGVERPENFFWCLSATLLAACGFSGFLAFAEPYHAIVNRLSKAGGAIGGWDSLHWTGRDRGVVVTDRDLFPPGAVKLNGIKLIGDVLSLETAVSYVATLVKETGSGMEKPFSDMMRSQGGLYRKAYQVVCHEGGVTGIISGEQVIVGSAGFVELMGMAPPEGLRVKDAVFLGVDGRLVAIFALNYRMHPSVAQALDSLIANRLNPILATRDFLVIPEMLRKKFKLKVDAMEFPSLDRRRELSSKRLGHDENISALLCREGLGPYAEAVVGGKRLVGATRMGVCFSLLGSVLGMALAFYLTLMEAYASLSAGSLLLFLLIWLVPAILVAGWTDRY